MEIKGLFLFAHNFFRKERKIQWKKINILTKYPNTSLVYWTINDKDGQLVNTGTTSTNNSGLATVILTGSKEQKNEGYIILPREVYFRAVLDSATLSKVETAKI